MDFPTRFDAKEAEPRLYSMWEAAGAFTADPRSKKPPFVNMIPPPNITGALHLGHALNNTLQDVLARWKRMSGFETLYLPGTDHAGISTQMVVERELKKEGKSRHDLGREKFIERCWAWKKEYGDTILGQLRLLGSSVDWTRAGFTMSEPYNRAVRHTFVALFNKGLIYRGHYVINWCPNEGTALSDLEVKKADEAGHLWHIRYPLKGRAGTFVTVATTRPETMLGDVAVAVNPKDARYKDLVGKTLVLPLMNREIPVIADDFVESDFGTGAVKVTPAHDLNDFECARRHKLDAIHVIGPSGKMNENAGEFKGQDRFAARKAVVAALEAAGLLEKTVEHTVPLARCERCKGILEPLLSEQWFMKMKGLAEPAIQAVKDGDIRFIPERWSKLYFDWMENIRDWCISRQLWWGHRIPVWYCPCDQVSASETDLKACPKCKGTQLRQDEDVLDTWFSSALWPFATLDWPGETEDLRKFYPGNVLVTSRDIINLWVARMIMTGFEFRGKKPFTDVIIHATLLDDEGKRQSKSKGTGVDFRSMISEYGADALRFALAWLTTGTQDLRFGSEVGQQRVEMARNFVTKLWNASRFVAMNAGATSSKAPSDPGPAERWILSRLNSTVEAVDTLLKAYEFGPAAQRLYEFVWDDYCNWYIELTKGRIEEGSVKETLSQVLDVSLRLLHPFCPFVTEELWQRRGSAKEKLLITAAWPVGEPKRIDPRLEQGMAIVFDAVRAIRLVRNDYKIPSSEGMVVDFSFPDSESKILFEKMIPMLKALENITPGIVTQGQWRKDWKRVVSARMTADVKLGKYFDPVAEKKKQEQERAETLASIERMEKQLANEAFRKAKPEMVAELDEKLAMLKAKARIIDQYVKELAQ